MKLPPGHVAGQGVARPTGYGGLGERLLKGMGWEKGQGLGRRRDGIKEAIAVKKKEDTIGVGGSTSWAWADNFWEKAFDQASARAASKSLLRPSDSSSSSSITDESDTSSDEGRERPANKPSTSSSSSSDSSTSDSSSDGKPASLRNKDGTLASGSTDELRLLASLSKGSGRVAAGRFSGRGAKMARLRAQEESAAQALAMGNKVGIAGAEPGIANKASFSGSPCVEETHTRIVVEIAAVSPELTAPLAPFVPTPSVGWWGCAQFQSAGCLTDPSADRARAAELERAAEAAGKRGFGEDDQAAVYMAAFAGQTKGRVGLGQGSGPLKIGGVKWGGTRTVLGDEEEARESGQGREVGAFETWTSAAGWSALVAEVCSSVAEKRLALSTLVALLRPQVARALEESEWTMPSDRDMRKELRLHFQTSHRATLKSKEVKEVKKQKEVKEPKEPKDKKKRKKQ
ncbi:hypothetical protein H632_c1370p0 [Helicosporidium sp. ATCC 50920]|nr:hypothetical protein H632_c1370p0 [Helicosporidium sp. ATCC 50920]|eukprot:KDD74363.1 hypothetical protein H632_c1370p0 [Helicosporidium sp. ATCC 50920]